MTKKEVIKRLKYNKKLCQNYLLRPSGKKALKQKVEGVIFGYTRAILLLEE